MLSKGAHLLDFAYTFSDREYCMWDLVRAIDFSHAAKALYRRVPSSERSKRVRLCCNGFSGDEDYDGPVFGLRKYF